MDKRIDIDGNRQLVVNVNNERQSLYVTLFWYGPVPDEVAERLAARITDVVKIELKAMLGR